ncbi:lantibiotic dehydratase family protein [Algoriphagus sp. AGSA1]|uniref:lantibiotic dehydratase n=1 Tax=Algoriphagus sp. AGSA1 TaxID=2907213 RepID=UPI001F1ADD08|nr:lantibiotic dehydratase [Algoriphagus sp. AGSA1]MCE7057165.1 lantibiotic dehydratase family protein [Algoriphagus sp. AGSA1]
MTFLYRLPLFQFDHEDPASIAQHWDIILNSIKLSSTSFYKELEEKDFKDLNLKQRIKLRKYLLRGRFRPTPFGRFAGVGIGTWGKEIMLEFPLHQTEIIDNQTKEQPTPATVADPFQSNYHLIPGIYTRHMYYHALIFELTSHSWKGCKLPVNPLIEGLIKTGEKEPLNFKKFQQLISPMKSDISTAQQKFLWEQILDSGFLVPETITGMTKPGIDMLVKNRLTLPGNLREQLKDFTTTAGSLFSKEESTYMRDFKKWFTTQFDDRHIRLSGLLTYGEFLSGQFLQPQQEFLTNDIDPILMGHHTQHPMDLKEFLPLKKLDEGIYDIQLLFRLDALGNPIIENIVCNRPFVYTGRFNRDPEIKGLCQQIKKNIYADTRICYAHVKLLESVPVQHICNVANVFDFEITPFKPSAPNELGFDELYIGIWENHVQLIHKSTEKTVIPVILHPLNGEQITHPILRLLWEAAHQEKFRFLPYQSRILSQLPYCPQLNWGNLRLQSRKWKLDRESVSTTAALSQKLEELAIPQHVLAGYADRELLLTRSNPDDLKILWQELQRDKTLTLSDPAWFPTGLFRSQDTTASYPQFVFQLSRPQLTTKEKWSFNPITHSRQNCLCFTVTVGHTEIPEVLERLLYHLEDPQVLSQSPKYFYLLYGKNKATEIRLRLLDLDPLNKRPLLASFSEFLSQENLDWKTAAYFPETAKYGDSGLEISHQLFHLESKFMACKSNGVLNLCYPPGFKEDLIVHLWRIIFYRSPHYSSIFTMLKDDVKRMPFDQVKTFRCSFEYLTTFETLGFESEKYLALICSHEYFQNGEDAGILLVFNHLHVMINRFFPLETHHYEQRIRYRLYREAGRQVYAFQQPMRTLAKTEHPEKVPFS